MRETSDHEVIRQAQIAAFVDGAVYALLERSRDPDHLEWMTYGMLKAMAEEKYAEQS